MARKPRSAKKGPPLTVGMIRKAIEGLPDASVVMCLDTEDKGYWCAHSVEVKKFLSMDYGLDGVSTSAKKYPNDEEELCFELKEPILMIDFVRPKDIKEQT